MVGPIILVQGHTELRALKVCHRSLVSASGADRGKSLALKVRKVCHRSFLVSASVADGGKSSRFPLPVTQVTSAHTFKSKQVEGSTEEEIDVVMEHATQTRPDRKMSRANNGVLPPVIK